MPPTNCPSCGRPIDGDADFCACGEYLRWEPTTVLPAIQEPAPGERAVAPTSDAGRRAGTQAHPAPSQGGAPTGPPAGSPAPPDTRTRERLPAAQPGQAASLTLRLPDSPSAAPDEVALPVTPGGRAIVLGLVRNQSGIVDNYDLEVRGIPRGWWTINPGTVYLVPYGSAGTYEQEVQIELHPPRTADAEARAWDLEVGVFSRAEEREVAAQPIVLGILPYEDFQTTLSPERRAGRRKVKYDVSVRNRANAPADVAIGAQDVDGECRTKLLEPTLHLAPGETGTTTLEVRPPRQLWLGRGIERRIEVSTATGDDGDRLLARDEAAAAQKKRRGKPGVPGLVGGGITKGSVQVGPGGINVQGPRVRAPQVHQVDLSNRIPGLDLGQLRGKPEEGEVLPLPPTQVAFRQKPWLPWWLAVVIPLLIALLILLYLLWPRTTEVPKVTGSPSVFAAQQKLEDKGLKLDPNVQKVARPAVKPGTVVAQAPKAGKTVDKGSAIAIQVAVGTGSIEVPNITGQTLPDAEKTLRDAGLVVGRISKNPPDLKAKIGSQIPAAGESVKEGSPIDVYYGKPGKEGGAGGAAGAAGAGGGGGGDIAVPAIDPKDAQGYSAKVADAGLVPQAVQEFSAAPKGEVFGTEPAVGTKLEEGAPVRVLISAGFPQLVFDDDRNVLRIDGATGKRLDAVAKTPATEKDATWAPDGVHVAYAAGGRIMLADTSKPDEAPVPLTPAGERYADPSFAPTTEAQVLAMARVNSAGGNDRDFCVGLVTEDGVRPQCKEDADFGVSDAKWTPDGKTVFVPAIRKDQAFGIVRYRSDEAFSPRADSWRGGEFVTPLDAKGGTGVIDLAVSPDGKQIGVVSNIDSAEFRLAFTTLDDLGLEQAKRRPVQACKVVWRPDGKEVVIVQSGAGCEQQTGQLLRLAVDKVADAVPLSASGDNPSFQPLTGGG